MKNDLKDILSNSNKDIDNQQLMDYLSNRLSRSETHEVEKQMAGDEFMNDAVEGLQKIENKNNMEAYVESLNRDLQNQIAKNKYRKNKRRLKDDPHTYVTIIILLLLMVISFLILRKYLESRSAALPLTPIVVLASTGASAAVEE